MNGEARPIGTCLIDPGSPAAALFLRAQALQRYQQALHDWARSMPNAISMPVGVLRAVNLRSGTLVIHVDNAAALTTLRYRLNELLQNLQRRFGTECSQIEVKVRPTPHQNA